MNKEQIISKMKNGSLVIGILCILAAIFNGVLTFMYLVSQYIYVGRDANGEEITIEGNTAVAAAKNAYLRNGLTALLSMTLMIIAAILFFRIAKSGVPFSSFNITLVRIIGGLMILGSFLPGFIAHAITGFSADGIFLSMISPVAMINGLLIFFLAYIIKYGAMLQQESDETL